MEESEGDRRVVVASDASEAGRESVGDALAAAFDVRRVETAGACLSRAEAGSADAVLAAHDLPGIDGLGLLRSIRLSRPALPFVLAPASGSEALAGEALAAGADGYVPADADAETVVARVRDALEETGRDAGASAGRRYRSLVESSPAPINVFDADGRSIWGNDAVLDLLGLDDRADLIGRSIFELVHPDDHERARRELASVVEAKEATGPTEMRLRTPGRGTRYVRVSTAVGRFRGADVGQAIAVDVTGVREREHQLQLLDRWLRHNVRNEMTVIRGLAEDLRRGAVDDVSAAASRISASANTLLKQAEHERELIETLTESLGEEFVRVNVAAVARRQVMACAAANPHADVELIRADDVEARVLPALSTAVRELLDNAVRHSDVAEPRVEVSVERDGDTGVIRVADDGPGIPAGERDALSVDAETDQLHHGSGLGLALVYWLVRRSGGDVAFSENDPRGSVVTVRL
ncbi:hypothetical protein GCM10009037_03360 [Halarchaeum grantii]|uniref:histidine kinase n=1 Tax=Halarchaeum grantii TaxID=1193105 RepID=A0A830EYT6_9EURY|nr:ATP-binding protein [Halarchaeum grantii]GGL23200.1 hypothetical protein GCM10009037_03360 [Halarchaeum grantii]